MFLLIFLVHVSILYAGPVVTTVYPATDDPSGEAVGYDTECKCNPKSVWNDVMFVIERSTMTGSDGLSEVFDTVLTTLSFMNVQTNETEDPFHVRVGVVFYSSEAVVAAPLGSSFDYLLNLNSEDFYNKTDNGNYLLLGLNLANAQLDLSNPARRRNSRKVIVIMATTYNPAGFYAPQTAAQQFRDDNGIIITYDYIEKGGMPANSLEQIASPGYGLTSANSIQDLLQVHCSANCFCAANLAVYTTDSRLSPSAGCYSFVSTAASQTLAERNCRNRHDGVLVKIDEEEKNIFVGAIDPVSDILIGLKWNSSNLQWMWSDYTQLQAFSNFAVSSSYVPGLDCIYMEKNTLQWKQVECRQGFKYVCQLKPCDSLHYCGGEE